MHVFQCKTSLVFRFKTRVSLMTSMLITLSYTLLLSVINLFLVGSMLTLALLAYQTPHIDTQLVKCVTYQAGEALLVRLFLFIKSEFQSFLPISQNSISHTPDQLVGKMKNEQSHIESWRPCNIIMTSLCHMYIAAQRMQELLEAFFACFYSIRLQYLMVGKKNNPFFV